MTDPFDYSDDTVSAKLTVDLPNDTINNIDTLVEQTGKFRANLQAAAKAQMDYQEYLRELPNLMADADRAQSGFHSRVSAAALAGTANDPEDPINQRTVTDWSGEEKTRQDLRALAANNPRQAANFRYEHGDEFFYDSQSRMVREAGGSDHDRAMPTSWPTPVDTARRERARERGPVDHSSAPISPGTDNTGPPSRSDSKDFDWEAMLGSSVDRMDRIADNIFNATRSGRSQDILASAGRMAGGFQHGVGNLSRQLEREAANLESGGDQSEGGVAGMLGGALGSPGALRGVASVLGKAAPIGAAAAAAVGGYQIFQKGGEWMQGHKNVGLEMGGGMSDGLGFEMGVQTMALNPFISTEQARKVMNSALNEGYTGKEFDTVTDFMAENLKDMNVSVEQSVRLLRKQVTEGGMSLEGAQAMMQMGHGLAAKEDSGMTTSQHQSSMEMLSSAAVDTGANLTDQDMSIFSGTFSGLFDEQGTALGQGFGEGGDASWGTEIGLTMFRSPVIQARIGAAVGYRGNPAGAFEYAKNEAGLSNSELQEIVLSNVISAVASNYERWKDPRTKQSARDAVSSALAKDGFNPLTPAQIDQLFEDGGPDGTGIIDDIEELEGEVEEHYFDASEKIARSDETRFYSVADAMSELVGSADKGVLKHKRELAYEDTLGDDYIDPKFRKYGMNEDATYYHELHPDYLAVHPDAKPGDDIIDPDSWEVQEAKDGSLETTLVYKGGGSGGSGGGGGPFRGMLDLTDNARRLLRFLDENPQYRRDANTGQGNMNEIPAGEQPGGGD